MMNTMMRFTAAFCALGVLCGCVTAKDKQAMTPQQARELYKTASDEGYNTPFKPNAHPDAQWFGDAGFGLFVHWGIHSVDATHPSWSMYDNRFAHKAKASHTPEEYYKLAEKFNPQKFDADAWMQRAKAMGMKYAVITAKHHDGYCLWPTEYGKYNTKNYMGGRDLIREYVDAARKHGIKVGLYFSPRDWAYNDHVSAFGVPAQKFDGNNPKKSPFADKKQNKAEYKKWLDFTIGQLSELLTNYGQIDVLWFDGANWIGVKDPKDDKKVRNWIYQLQPQIVINPRWGGKPINPDYVGNANDSHGLAKISKSIGDYYTYEAKSKYIHERSEGLYADIWFEFCQQWYGHWGYTTLKDKETDPKKLEKIVEMLTLLRSFGGNYLLNVGPDGNGEWRPDIIAESKLLAAWMDKNRSALLDGTGAFKTWEKISPVPLTRNGNDLFVHLVGNKQSEVELKIDQVPVSAQLLATGEKLEVTQADGEISFSVPTEKQQPYSTIVKLSFNELTGL